MRLRYVVNPLLAVIVGLAASLTNTTRAEQLIAPVAQSTRPPIVIQLQPGDSLAISCVGDLRGTVDLVNCAALATMTPTRTATRTPRPTRTATRTATLALTSTATLAPTQTATATATHDHGAPTSTPGTTATEPPAGAIYDSMPITASILGTCSAAVHDRYTATGPDGGVYRTWHPQVVDDGAGGTCTFAHEHGVDPDTSDLVGADPVTFGYESRIAELDGMPMPEAHEGFKVHVANTGDVNDEARVSRVTALVLAHMGTGGVRRYLAPMHTLHVQAEMPDGARVNVRGMADTGDAGSICARDRGDIIIGRAVQTVPGVPETANAGQPCEIVSPYEIWQFALSITRNRSGEDPLLTFNVSLAAFDPITTMDPRDRNLVLYTGDVFPASRGGSWADYNRWRGCDREFYVGSAILRNAVAAQVWTDAHGNVRPGTYTPATAIRQVMVLGNVFDPRSSASAWGVLSAWRDGSGALSQFKLQQPTCAPGLGTRN
jgi:hypothetical protein